MAADEEPKLARTRCIHIDLEPAHLHASNTSAAAHSSLRYVFAYVAESAPPELPFKAWARRHRLQIIGSCLSVLAAVFPVLAIDPSKTSSTIERFEFHPDFLRTSLLPSGMSPYNSRALNPWSNFYRCSLYVVVIAAFYLGARASWRTLRGRQVSFGTTVFVAAVVLTIALPVSPNMINGSAYFTSRLVFVIWPAVLLAASAAPAASAARERWLAAAAVACCVLTLIPAQIFIRPAAEQLRLVDQQRLPRALRGSLLMGDQQDEYVRLKKQLAFDPYKWGQFSR